MEKQAVENWAAMEAIFGLEFVSAVDTAIGETLSDARGNEDHIKRDDFYLVSERLSWAVLSALYEKGLQS